MTHANAAQSAPLMLSVSGCRGIVGATMTPETAARFAGAFAGWVSERAGTKRPTIVFGKDGRAGNEALHMAAVSGLLAAGAKVIDLDVAATPTVGVMVEHHGANGGLILTASHNPAEWNGLKCIAVDRKSGRAKAPSAGEAAEIIARFRDGAVAYAPHDRQGTLNRDATGEHAHVSRVLKAVSAVAPVEEIRARQFRVAVDSVNASGAKGARLLLDALDCRLTHLHADGSGVFPHSPEPTAENLKGFSDEVRAAGAQVGFAQDTDADRLALLDEDGAYIGEEQTLALAARAILEFDASARGSELAANLSTSRMIDDVAHNYGGGAVRRTAVGEANVAGAMLEHGCLIGGEGNGGVIWPAVTVIRDSLGAMALILALMTRTGRTLSELVREMPSYVIEKRKATVREGVAEAACSALASQFDGGKVDTQDGVRIDFDGGGEDPAWVHVRASNTEPILRLIAEAKTTERATQLLDEAQRVVEGL
jgi:phosphomannomutase